EEAALYSIIQLEDQNCVLKYMSEINFINSAVQGAIVEIGIDVVSFGKTSITLKCEARNKLTREAIATVDQLIFLVLDENGKPKAHGKTKIEYVKDRLESTN
ncbi:MAG: hotdog domain-containing protein, partial [Robiginitalea sp.]|uniref:hotdog domain-containing protein n=1 Tax=Robiginitalea sp. TaxID=1902411 RepID=UPI003C77ADBD